VATGAYNWASIFGLLLNSLAGIVMLAPFLFVYNDGKFKRKTKERILDISATKYGENKALAEELFLARSCACIAFVLLAFGTALLLYQPLIAKN
jgi:hypothetical protein